MNGPFRLLLLVVLTAVTTAAQQPPAADPQPSPPTFRSRVNLVRVDVTVLGRGDEAVVADLQPADFAVEEDGIRQRVETLQFLRLDGTRTGNLDESLAIRSPEHAAVEAARDDVRLFAIFLDDYHVDRKPFITVPVRQALKRLVEQFGPNDLIAVMDPLTPLSHLSFTRSRDDLLQRMAEFEGRRGETFPVKSPMEEEQLGQRNLWEVRAGVTLSALTSLVTRLGGLREGRKSVLFVSQGPPLGRVGSANHQRLESALQAANRGNVTIHVLDPRPLGASPFGGADSLYRLSHETGGRAIVNTNDHAELIGRIVDDASAYYLLGYAPTRDLADGKFHKITVKVQRGGVRVLARQGYWAPTAKEMTAAASLPPPEPGLVAALTNLVQPREGRRAVVWVGTSRGPEALTRVELSWDPSDRAFGRDASVVFIDPVRDGTPIEAERRSIAAASSGTGERVATFDVAPGTTMTWRFTAQAEDGFVVDQWQESLVVPTLDDAPLELSTPRVLRARTAFEMRALDRGSDPPPTASRRFRRGERVMVDVECYGDAPAPQVTAQLLNGRGDRLMDLPASTAPAGRTRFVLPLTSVAPGTYVLRLQAHTAEHSASERVAFYVQ